MYGKTLTRPVDIVPPFDEGDWQLDPSEAYDDMDCD